MRASTGAALALALAALAGCATPPPADGTPAPAPTLPPTGSDTCGAAEHAALIGGDYRRVPPARTGQTIRVACTTCAITEDFSAQRLNVFYDASTGKIVRLSCG